MKKDNPTRILIIDDEPSIRNIIRLHLHQPPYKIFEAWNGESGVQLTLQCKPHIIILDLGLGDISGQDILKNIRKWSNIPIIILSINNNDHIKTQLLDQGADDYMTKPFSPSELRARVKVCLRHYNSDGATPTFSSLHLFVDLIKHQVFFRNELIKLTATEFEILRILIKNGGRVVSTDHLLREIWGATALDKPHYLRIYIGQLRKKLKDDGIQPQHIITEPGVGYRIC